MSKRLYRSWDNKVISGVCGGIADYFHVDPVLIRLAFVVLGFVNFFGGIVAYLVAALVIPMKGANSTSDVIDVEVVDEPVNSRRGLGLALIALGFFLILYRIFCPGLLRVLLPLGFAMWPLALVVLGLILLLKSRR